MRRTWPIYGSLFLAIALLGAFAYFTHVPDSPWLDRAEGWFAAWPAWIGEPAASVLAAFRAAYPPDGGAVPSAGDLADDPGPGSSGGPSVSRDPGEVSSGGDGSLAERRALAEQEALERLLDRVEARGVVHLVEGEILRAGPAPDAAPVTRLTVYATLPLLERSEGWVRVRWRGREGWAAAENLVPPSGEPPLGRQASRAGASPAAPASRERVDALLERLGPSAGAGQARSRTVGPYRLVTDVEDDLLLAALDRLAGSLEGIYRGRYGVAPQGSPQATVALFARQDDYQAFRRAEGRPVGPSGHAGGGLAALAVGEEQFEEVAASMVHEVVHLLNRRALGPQLPPWLDEGLAQELALSRVVPLGRPGAGRLEPGTIGGRQEPAGGQRVEIFGGRAVVLSAGRDLARMPRVETLMELDRRGFAAGGERHYAWAGLWVHYLLEGEGGELARPFRDYLAGVARGEDFSPERLRQHLDRPWSQLDAGLRAWVRLRASG